MFPSSQSEPVNDPINLEHIIHHDIVDIEDLDEFLADDPEDCMHVMLGNAGCFY